MPNDFGLYDTLGNVFEWCADWRDDYTADPVFDPSGPTTSPLRAARGGSYGTLARAAWRLSYPRELSIPNIGFRLARGAE